MTQVCRQLFLAQKVNRTLSYQKTLRLKRVDCGRTVTVVRHRHLANGSALLIANIRYERRSKSFATFYLS